MVTGRAGVTVAAAGIARAGAAVAAWAAARGEAVAPGLRAGLAGALQREIEERRFFLWLPVMAMGGVALNLSADREPALWAAAVPVVVFAGLAYVARARPLAFGLFLALAALFAGFLSMSLRTARVAAPVLDRVRIVTLEGLVEEVDLRPVGARIAIAVAGVEGMPAEKAPARVRVTSRKTPEAAAGDFVRLKARLLPPSRAVMPGGYDFARDAFFAGFGAVGSALGAVEILPPPRRSPGASAFRPRSTAREIVWRCASTASSAATRGRSPPPW